MSTQKNKRHQFPHSLLAHLKTALGDRFTVLPERIQQGYTKLLWDNQYITKANRHTKDSASWKTSAETLKLLFGDPQIFRDVNTNGFYMNSNRHTLKSKYKLCCEDDQDATYYPPTDWVKILLVLFIIGAFFRWMGHQELNTLIEEGVLSSDYTQLELAMLCANPDDDVQPTLGCIVGGVW